jgi:CHASE2 domain-containing sensor protein
VMYSTIPSSQIPDDALAFMIERCRAAGAKIIGL